MAVKLLKSIFSLVLALLVTVSSMGVFVDHMVCGMSGEHKLAINQSIESCSDTCDRSEEESVDRPCCDYDSNYFQEDVPVNPTEKTKKQQFSSFKYIPLANLFEVENCAEACCFSIHDDEPIPSVKRHILFEIYLI